MAISRLRRESGLAAAAILTLGVGVGASVAMFSVVRAVLLRPLGITAPDRLVVMWPMNQETSGEFTFNAYQGLRDHPSVFDAVAIMGSTTWSGAISIAGRPSFSVPAAAVSASFFDVLDERMGTGCLKTAPSRLACRGRELRDDRRESTIRLCSACTRDPSDDVRLSTRLC